MKISWHFFGPRPTHGVVPAGEAPTSRFGRLIAKWREEAHRPASPTLHLDKWAVHDQTIPSAESLMQRPVSRCIATAVRKTQEQEAAPALNREVITRRYQPRISSTWLCTTGNFADRQGPDRTHWCTVPCASWC
jgi:hypothetical protein